MSPTWTPRRERRLIRNPDGTFREWTGGEADNRDSSFKGMHTHLTADFKRQEGRSPRVGDVHRRENQNRSPHAQSFYYIRSPFGWRRSETEQRRPTAKQVKDQISRSRRGGRR